jgi:hypothetical protein
MTEQLAAAISRPGSTPAFLTATGVFAALIVQGFLGSIFGSLAVLADTSIDDDLFGQLWSAQLAASLSGPLPIAIGVFLCFWQIAPIAPRLRLAHVVTRALLAALAGGFLLFLIALGYWAIVQLLGGFGQDVASWVAPLGDTVPAILFRSLTALVSVVPLVVLGAILLWGWLQRHPAPYEVRGTLDEV